MTPRIDRRRVLSASGALLAAALFAGCLSDGDPGGGSDGDESDADDADPDDEDAPAVDEAVRAELVRENTEFAFDLHRTLVAADPAENLLASPYSISVALAMTYAGARDETAEQMADALGYTLDEDDLHEAFAALEARLAALGDDVDVDGDDEGGDEDEGVPFTLNLANAVWGQTDYPFYEDYLDFLETHYGAGMRSVDYQADPEAAREEINAWVADRTEDRIDELLPEGSLDELARLVLTNAVYFEANWEHTFPEDRTADGEFTALDGSTRRVPMMNTDGRFPHAEVDGHQLIDLPYAGGDASMLIVLPEDGAFEGLEAEIDAEWLAGAVDALEAGEGTIAMPKFGFESGFQLEDALSELGMPIAFEYPEADFGDMADLEATGEGLFIWDVYHDTFIEVDENGTEAAAATGVVVGTESAAMDPFEMTVDRPFLFAIRDRGTGAVVFLGRVVDPDAG
ncbi:serpin family protein [Haloferacaceae archaeon DSL9]